MWDHVCECISDIFTASMPTELLTWKPPERLYRTQSNASLGSSFSSISESPLPPTGRPVSVASVESSAIEPHALPNEETEVATTEAPTAPEITVIPSSPPTEDKQTEENNATLTNIPINAQDDSKNSEGDSKNNAPDDATASDSTLTGDVLDDKGAVTDVHSHDHAQQHVKDAVSEETVENAPLLNEETDHPASHDTPQHHHVPASSGKPPVNKQAQQKEKKQKGTGSFLQRKKRGSTGSGAGKRKSNATTSITETSNRKDIHAKKPPHKLSHLQSPDADLAKSKFNKIGMMITCSEYCSL